MKNNKGFTVIELIVSFSIILVVVFFLFQIVLILKDLYTTNGIKATLLNRQAILNEKVYKDFDNGVIGIENCTVSNSESEELQKNICMDITFMNYEQKRLTVDYDEKKLQYGDYVMKLDSGSNFSDFIYEKEYVETSNYTNNTILKINIGITNVLIEGDFGLNLIYQFQDDGTDRVKIPVNF